MYKVTKNDPLFSLPTIELSTMASKYNDEQFAHEAGFDAWMTGYNFIKMVHLLGTFNDNLITVKILLLRIQKLSFPLQGLPISTTSCHCTNPSHRLTSLVLKVCKDIE
jgi:hypothetical protein